MRQPLHGDGFDEGIRHDDLLPAQRGRVAVVGRVHVRLQCLAQAREAAEQFEREAVRRRPEALLRQLRRRVIGEALVNFVLQFAQHRIQQRRRCHFHFR